MPLNACCLFVEQKKLKGVYRDCTLLGGRVNEARNAHSVDKMTTDDECHSPLTLTRSFLRPLLAVLLMISSTTLLFLPSFARLSSNFSLHHRWFPSQSQRRRRMVTAPPTFGPNCLRLPGDGRTRGRTGRGRRKISLFAPAPRPTDRTTDRPTLPTPTLPSPSSSPWPPRYL